MDPARSLDLVADAFDRARPAYPPEAVRWMLEDVEPRAGAGAPTGGAPGEGPARVVELGAGTGRFTETLVAAGCTVVAADVSETTLQRAGVRVPEAGRAVAAAERLPFRSRSADLVTAASSFHRFDAAVALPECARVLRPGGRLALLWTVRDERIPWVRRLGRLVESVSRRPEPDVAASDALVDAIDESGIFGAVERSTFRSWQPTTRDLLRELVRSEPRVAHATQAERERLLGKVDELYDSYGRGADGMLLPHVTTVLRTTVLPWAVAAEPEQVAPAFEDDALLIDFR